MADKFRHQKDSRRDKARPEKDRILGNAADARAPGSQEQYRRIFASTFLNALEAVREIKGAQYLVIAEDQQGTKKDSLREIGYKIGKGPTDAHVEGNNLLLPAKSFLEKARRWGVEKVGDQTIEDFAAAHGITLSPKPSGPLSGSEREP